MKMKRIAMSAQQKLAHVLPEQRRRRQPVAKNWPVSDGRGKTVMWQPTCWPSGENIPRGAQRLFQR